MNKWIWIGVVSALGMQATIAEMSVSDAQALFVQAPETDKTNPYAPTTHPEAQWFSDAGFGLFIHWGIYSCRELNPSWSMLDNRFAAKYPRNIEVDDYYALADEFNPQRYNPDEWMKMAKSMGMTYAVITTKHHDGYCLWPSAYGDYNTRNGAGGRDLLRDYVDAARKYGLKVGFYFSPRDWGYNNHVSGFTVPVQKFDSETPKTLPFPEEENLERYEKWVDYTVAQLSELLTQYGQIDVLWFDGANWMGDVPDNETGNKIRNWIYQLQPQIVINPRWGSITNPDYTANASAGIQKIHNSAGDFYTFESKWDHIVDPTQNAGVLEPIWFEFCDIWKSWGWGYVKATSEQANLERMRRTLERLSTLRAFGGNYLLNIGPGPDGGIRADILAEAKLLSPWIQARKEAFWNVTPVKNWKDLCDAPLTRRDQVVYVHLTGEALQQKSDLLLKTSVVPSSIRLLGDATVAVPFSKSLKGIEIMIPADGRNPLGEVVQVEFVSDPFYPGR